MSIQVLTFDIRFWWWTYIIKLMLIYFYVRFPLARNHESQSQLRPPPGHCFFSVWIYVGASWPSGCGRCRALPVGLVQSMYFIHEPLDKRSWPYQKVAQDVFFFKSITTVKPFHETPSLEREINLSIPSFSLAVTNSSLRFRNKAPILYRY